jgi:hypothetical protein
MTVTASRTRAFARAAFAALVASAFCAGCAGMASKDRAAWDAGRTLQREGKHEEALAALEPLLGKYRNIGEEETAALHLDAARSHAALADYARAEEIVKPLRAEAELEPAQRAETLEISGWAALWRAIYDGAADARALLRQARTYFYDALELDAERYGAMLGQGLALYETSRLLDTKTHLARALELFGRCAAQRPDDPVLLFAQARAMQRVLGPGTPEALALLAKACRVDAGLRVRAAYAELMQELAPYPNPRVLAERVPERERRAILDTYRELLEKAAALPAARGEFWDSVRAHLAAYRAWGAKEAAFAAALKDARRTLLASDFSPLGAAEEALRRLDEAAAAAAGDAALASGAEYAAARAEIVESLLAALKAKLEQTLELENLGAAETLFAKAFARIADEKLADQVGWARQFQDLRERRACRKDFMAARADLRTTFADKPAEDIRAAVKALGEKFRACTIERDIAELREELLAAQSATFQRALAEASRAEAANDGVRERDALAQALALAAQKEFAHREGEILLRIAKSYARADLWPQAREHLERIESARRPPEAWLLLGAALAQEGRDDDALRILARKDLADDLAADARIACAAGLVFARKDQPSRAVPLLAAALERTDADLPLARDKALGALCGALAALLRGATPPAPREVALAQELVDSRRGDAALGAALGAHFMAAKRWDKALAYVKDPSPALLARLKACAADFAPLREGGRWEYLQGDGARVTVTCERDLGNGRFAVRFQVGSARTDWQWEKREGGAVLCRFFGASFERCHVLPIALTEAAENAPLPARSYEINGKPWTARVAEVGALVATPAGEFKDCLRVDVLAPGDAQPVQYFFAPGVGEVKVVDPRERTASRELAARKD